MLSNPEMLLIITLTFLLAGTVKGVIGLGLPSVSLGLLTAAIDLPSAMALLLIPSFVTNAWQALVGGNGGVLIRRLWPFLLMATLTVWAGGRLFAHVNVGWAAALLGVLLALYAVISLAGVRLQTPKHKEGITGPLFGAANGVLTGITGSFVVPGVMYLQSIGLSRDALVQAMGMLFTLSTLALAVSLYDNALLTSELGVVSAAGVIPALIGMVLGQKVRQKLSESQFRRVFFWAILLLGLYIMAEPWLTLAK
jgi:uncharacterized membrane protein YfcA